MKLLCRNAKCRSMLCLRHWRQHALCQLKLLTPTLPSGGSGLKVITYILKYSQTLVTFIHSLWRRKLLGNFATQRILAQLFRCVRAIILRPSSKVRERQHLCPCKVSKIMQNLPSLRLSLALKIFIDHCKSKKVAFLQSFASRLQWCSQMCSCKFWPA